MLAYTNRFLGLASVARHLIETYGSADKSIHFQIDNLRTRIQLVRHAQALGVLSLALCTLSLFLLFLGNQTMAKIAFGTALLFMLGSLSLSLREIHLSARALDKALADIPSSTE